MIRHRTRDSCHHLDVSNGYTDQHLVSAPADDIPSNLLMFCYSRQDTELQLQGHLFHSLIKVREHLPEEKLISFGHCPNYLPPPNSGKLYNFFGRHKRCLARITEPSNYDYDNDVSDYNFGTFDDFGVKNDQKVSYNMILMSKYKGQHDGKKG